MHAAKKLKYCLLWLFCSCHLAGLAQQTDSIPKDSISGFVQRVKKNVAKENLENIRLYREGKISITQRRTIENIQSLTQLVRLYMKDALDTLEIESDLERTRRSLAIAKDGITTNEGSTQTQRNLYVTATILNELLYKMSEQKENLDKYSNSLILYKDKLDSLTSDSSLYNFPSDSLSILKYAGRLAVMDREVRPVDSSLRKAAAIAQDLQLRVDLMLYQVRSFGEDIEIYRSDVSDKVLDRELPNVWGPVAFNRPLSEIIRFSWAKESMVFSFYVKENLGRLFIICLLILAAWLFTRSVKKIVIIENDADAPLTDKLVLKYPSLTSVFVVLNLFQFIFISPPFIFSLCFWCVSIICLTLILRNALAKFWTQFWYVSLLFFVLTAADNFLLQASRDERWFMLIISASGVALISYIFFSGHLKELKERGILYFLVFVALAEVASFILNCYGRYNFSKSLLITGYIGIVIAILFFWTIRLINEMLGVAFRIYKVPDRRMFYINFDKVGNQVPGIFYIILVVGWFIIVGRNYYAFRQITAPIEHFLTHTRTVGEFSFSISGMIIFLLIILLSAILSKLISFFATTSPAPHGTTKGNRIGIGSWLLLVRIFILTLGLVLAFAATGIPVDRLTIILGALSVGIGLGLQSLVTNLVSGLIIAFEKPVNVGDYLEVNGKMATMKSIGFRSSVVRLSDGAHVVIPNGDVLNEHLINWSMGKNIKRASIIVSVAYGTDLDKAKHILTNILTGNERILKNPSPVVHAKDFGAYSVDFVLFFWAGHVSEVDSVKSEVITTVDRHLKEAGITIPFPQQDINIRAPEVEKKPEDQK